MMLDEADSQFRLLTADARFIGGVLAWLNTVDRYDNLYGLTPRDTRPHSSSAMTQNLIHRLNFDHRPHRRLGVQRAAEYLRASFDSGVKPPKYPTTAVSSTLTMPRPNFPVVASSTQSAARFQYCSPRS